MSLQDRKTLKKAFQGNAQRAWFEKAAMQHHENAIKNLADLYYSIHDRENARKWYRIGANAGEPYCKEKLRRVGR